MPDIHRRDERFQKNITALGESVLSDHNTDLILDFKDHLLAQDFSIDRVARYISCFNTLPVR